MRDNALQKLKAELPQLFENSNLPQNWNDFSPINIKRPNYIHKNLQTTRVLNPILSNQSPFIDVELVAQNIINGSIPYKYSPAILGYPEDHAGAPKEGPSNSIEALAFYFPFHYHLRCWGLYILFDGMLKLAKDIYDFGKTTISPIDAIAASRLFLYSHEHFHFQVECFATRLELAHRKPFCIYGFEDMYNKTFGTNLCLEESLANAYALQEIKKKFKNEQIFKALFHCVKNSPPGYCLGIEYHENKDFDIGRARFSEDNVQHCLQHPKIFPSNSGNLIGQLNSMNPEFWQLTPGWYAPILNLKPRVEYLVHKNSLKYLASLNF